MSKPPYITRPYFLCACVFFFLEHRHRCRLYTCKVCTLLCDISRQMLTVKLGIIKNYITWQFEGPETLKRKMMRVWCFPMYLARDATSFCCVFFSKNHKFWRTRKCLPDHSQIAEHSITVAATLDLFKPFDTL